MLKTKQLCSVYTQFVLLPCMCCVWTVFSSYIEDLLSKRKILLQRLEENEFIFCKDLHLTVVPISLRPYSSRMEDCVTNPNEHLPGRLILAYQRKATYLRGRAFFTEWGEGCLSEKLIVALLYFRIVLLTIRLALLRNTLVTILILTIGSPLYSSGEIPDPFPLPSPWKSSKSSLSQS